MERDEKGRFVEGNKEGRKFKANVETGGKQSEIAKKGGEASGEAKRRKKTFAEIMNYALGLQVNNPAI